MPMFTTCGEALAGGAALAAVVHRGDEAAHAVAFGGGDFRGVLDAGGKRGLQPGIRRRAQRHVHRGAMFGDVDHLAGEQAAAEALQVGRLGEREQRVEHLGVDRRLGVVEGEVVEAGAEFMGAFGVGGEQRRDAPAVRACCQRGQPGEGGLASCMAAGSWRQYTPLPAGFECCVLRAAAVRPLRCGWFVRQDFSRSQGRRATEKVHGRTGSLQRCARSA